MPLPRTGRARESSQAKTFARDGKRANVAGDICPALHHHVRSPQRPLRKDMEFPASNDNGDSYMSADRSDGLVLEIEEEYLCRTNSHAPTATAPAGVPSVMVPASFRTLRVASPVAFAIGERAMVYAAAVTALG